MTGVDAKIERAKEHIDDLQAAIRAFHESKPYRVGARRDPETRKLVYHITRADPVPDRLAVITGDILQNLRSALDHTAHELVAVGKGHPGPYRHAEYPVFGSFDEYRAGKKRKTRGMRPEAKKAIDDTKPYKGGTDRLWQLHELNIRDKHRLLITVGSSYQSVDIRGIVAKSISQTRFARPVEALPSFAIRPAERHFPLEPGEILFIDNEDAEPNEHLDFRFEVALSEPGVVDGEPLVALAKEMTDLVEGLLPAFRPHLY